MNGVKFLLDTCFIIRWRKHDVEVFELLKKFNVQAGQCVYSDITYAEVFGWHGMTVDDERHFHALLQGMPRLPLTNPILERTIALRRTHKIKLPDALILATAQVHDLKLLTLDEKLARIHQQNP